MGFVTLNVGDPLLLGHNDILFLHLAQIHDAHAGTRSVSTGCTVMLGTNICSEPCEPYSWLDPPNRKGSSVVKKNEQIKPLSPMPPLIASGFTPWEPFLSGWLNFPVLIQAASVKNPTSPGQAGEDVHSSQGLASEAQANCLLRHFSQKWLILLGPSEVVFPKLSTLPSFLLRRGWRLLVQQFICITKCE